MNKIARAVLYVVTIAAVMLTSVVGTTTVYAEGGTTADPPTEDPAVTETTDPSTEEEANPESQESQTPPEDPASTETADPPSEDQVEAPPTEPAADPSEEDPDEVLAKESVAESPGEDADPDEALLEEQAPADEQASVPEIMEMVPEGTDLLVLNDEGTAEPLASQEASEILEKGDPVWCPANQAPGDSGCSGSHTSFNGLFVDLRDNGYAGDGVIWVEATYDRNQDSGTIEFDHTNGDLAQLDNLTIMGGWDGGIGSTITDPNNPSILDDALRFINWVGNISINNLDFDGANDVDASLVIETDGDITLENVTVTNNTAGSNPLEGAGARLDNCTAVGPSWACTSGGEVEVTDSEFSDNRQTGLSIDTGEAITVSDVTAADNGLTGIRIDTDGGIYTNTIKVTNVTVTGNVDGLHITDGGNLTLKNVTATDNTDDGVEVDDVRQNVTAKSITASNNTNDGIDIDDTGGDLTLKDITAINNGSEGITIVDTQGSIVADDITANQNTDDGIEIDNTRGNVYLKDVTANETSAGDGVDIHVTDGYVKLKSVIATHNNQAGIEVVNVDGSLTLQCVETSDNDGDGIYIEVDHGFTIKCSLSADNGGDGLQIVDAPTAKLLSFNSRWNTGFDINYDPNVTTVTEKVIDCDPIVDKPKPKHEPKDQPFTKLYCLPGEIKAALYDTYGDQIEFTNLCGYEAGVYDPDSWVYPETIPGGGDDYILSLQDKMLEEIPSLEPVTDFGIPGILAQVLDELPFMLPDGYFYASAFFTVVLDEGEYMDSLPEESELTIRFRVPEWLDPGEELTILWWDGADWVDMGGEYSEDGLYFQITTVETGVFVLSTIEAES